MSPDGIKDAIDASYTGNASIQGGTRMAASSFFGINQRRTFRKLVGNNRDRLYRMAYAWTHDPYLADDLVQQTVLKALNNQRQLRDMAAAEAWLFRILSNCLKDHHRAKREVLSPEALEIRDDNTPERETSEQQLVDTVRHAVSCLPVAQRQVVTLVDLEGGDPPVVEIDNEILENFNAIWVTPLELLWIWKGISSFGGFIGGVLTDAPHFERDVHFDGQHDTEHMVTITLPQAPSLARAA